MRDLKTYLSMAPVLSALWFASLAGPLIETLFDNLKPYVQSRQIMDLSIRPSIKKLYSTSASGIAYAESIYFLSLQTTKHQSAQQTHDAIELNTLEVNSQLKELVKSGRLSVARQLFDKLPHRDEVSWTTVVGGYINAFDTSEALSLFSKMWVDPTVRMDPFILSLALKACGYSSNARHGESLHGYCVKTGFVNSVFVGSALLDMYAKNGKIYEGCRVFDEMPIRNVVSWTAIVTGLVRAGFSKEGLMYFASMLMDHVQYDSYMLAIALKACGDADLLNYGMEIHAQAMKKGFDTSSFVANTLATMYNKCGKVEYGSCLFEKMSILDVVSWTSIITTYIHIGKSHQAIQTFLRMRGSGVCPNAYTFAAVITACEKIAMIPLGAQLHAHIIRLGFLSYLSVANSIMTMYSRCSQYSLASNVFHEMRKRDIISWSTIIAGYAKGGCGEEAFQFLSLMRREGQKPTEFALGSVLSVCGNMAILEQGQQLHGHVLSIGLDHMAMVRSGLINMYSKCGNIQEASKIFTETGADDIVSWTAMIHGYAEHGFSQEAIGLFEDVLKIGLRPDAVTFIGVLSACSHAGNVDLGFHYFNIIRKEHRINLSKEHYGCMIDLLCRAGRLNEAENMIKDMPFQHDNVVWSILLRACRMHGDVDRAISAAKKILELNPNCATTYITLANIYSAKGKWSEAAEVRTLMRSKGVEKEPGWSGIKVEDRFSTFVVGDRSHQRSDKIYSILELVASGAEIHVPPLLNTGKS